MQTNAPIFIVGVNRSGTTLLRLILNAHPRIAIPEEINYFNPWIDAHWAERAPNVEGFRRRVHWYLHEKLPPGVLPGIDLKPLEDEIVARADVYDWRAVYEGALASWAGRHEKARWGEKTPGNLFYVDTLRTMFPEAQFLHLVRDPRAGVQSMQNTSFFGGDVAINALNRRKYLREGLHRDATMPSGQWMRVRYEDLLRAPEATVRTLCDFLGEEFTPSMLTYYERAEQYMNPAAANGHNQAARRPIDASKADAWRDRLTPVEAARIESLCRHEMDALGYMPDGPSLSLRDRLTLLFKTLYWHLFQFRQDAPDAFVLDSPSAALRRLRGPERSTGAPSVPSSRAPTD
jgi:hypothetical protein